jgi:hypothetical protein
VARGGVRGARWRGEREGKGDPFLDEFVHGVKGLVTVVFSGREWCLGAWVGREG